MKNLDSEKRLGDVDQYQKWMPCPQLDTQHPGLAYICPLNELIVAKKWDALHAVIGNNSSSYTIFNNVGEKVFLAVQERHFQTFHVRIFNYYGNEVIHVKKPFRFCLHKATVFAPPGTYIGSIKKDGCVFLVENKLGAGILKIKAQGYCHYVYDILSGGDVVGVVKWQIAVMEESNFGVAFPVDMDVLDKAVLLGACFLIGYLKYS